MKAKTVKIGNNSYAMKASDIVEDYILCGLDIRSTLDIPERLKREGYRHLDGMLLLPGQAVNYAAMREIAEAANPSNRNPGVYIIAPASMEANVRGAIGTANPKCVVVCPESYSRESDVKFYGMEGCAQIGAYDCGTCSQTTVYDFRTTENGGEYAINLPSVGGAYSYRSGGLFRRKHIPSRFDGHVHWLRPDELFPLYTSTIQV